MSETPPQSGASAAGPSPAQPFRLAKGGLIDRTRPLRGRFDGAVVEGFAGDTLASALMARGERVVARSFKYHRPRGIMTAGSDEPNALVELRAGARREPNSKATTVEFYDGIEAASQNRWPSLRFDLMAVNQLFAPLFGAGFYYKTFMWPAAFWERVYEPLIRRAAGLGRAAEAADPDAYEHANAFCDVLVVGGGPSGLAAALAAARAGARVLLCDEDFLFGGRLLADRREIDGMPGNVWAARTVDELAAMPHARVLARTTVFGVYDGGVYAAVERVNDHVAVPPPHQPRQRLWRIVAKRCILAAGATERGIVFGGNDRAGVMLAAAMRSYTNRFAVAPGRRVAVFTNNNNGWRTAAELSRCGVEIAAIIDSRENTPTQITALGGTERVLAGSQVIATHAGWGAGLDAVTVRTPSATVDFPVDALAVSGGWNPNLQLTGHQGGRPDWHAPLAAFIPGDPPHGMAVVGAARGTMTLSAGLAEGIAAGWAAAEACGFSPAVSDMPKAEDESFGVAPLWHVAGSRGKAFVDPQNDVTVEDVELAEREGFRAIEHLKRYTTLGMATDQGRAGNVAGVALMAALTGRSIGETGTTRFRPPYTPVAIGALAGPHRGKHFRPTRLTPSHAWAAEQGAVFVETGPWLRAQYFPRAGEDDWLATVTREVETVRSAVGFCDVSTLGKIEIEGPDAGAFLDRLYINTFSTLAAGRVRYGLMLREDGFAFDDGTVARLGDARFFMTTTTANAVRVFQHMQFCHQVLWPELDLQFVSATDQWAQFSVAGPRARATLARLVDPAFDLSNAGFPYMACAELAVCGGVAARLYRLSFSGELAYEIGVPARYGDGLARALMQAGAPFGIAPYGTEALSVMRIEKGHVAGNELDGRTTAHDLGLGRMMSGKKDFIGRVLAGRPALSAPDRPVLVGLKPVKVGERLRAGAHLTPLVAAPRAANDAGVVTSVAYSPAVGAWIGLGLLADGARLIGRHVRAADPLRNSNIEVEVCAPCFVDPEGERLRG